MDLGDFPVVTGPAEEQLNEKQLLDYRQYREDFLSWSLAVGRNPMTARVLSTCLEKNGGVQIRCQTS